MSKNNGFPTREQVERIRKQYPKGTSLELIAMDDRYTMLNAGDRGTVDFVDDAGQIGGLGFGQPIKPYPQRRQLP